MILFLYVLMLNTIAFLIWGRLLNSLDSFARDKKNEHRLFWFVINGSILSIILTLIMYPFWEKTLYNLSGLYFTMNPFVAHFLIVGPVEEFSKFAVFITLSGMLKSIKEPRDAVLQAASVALGFALIENFVYAMENGLIVLVIRSVISTAGHISYGIIWGFAWGAAVYSSEGKKISPDWLMFIPAFVSAAVFHGAFNTLIDYGHPIAAISVKLVTLTIFFFIYKYTKKNSPYRAYALSEYRNAVPALKKGLKNHPDSPVLNKRLGLYFMYAGRYSPAEKYLRIAKKKRLEEFYYSILFWHCGLSKRQ